MYVYQFCDKTEVSNIYLIWKHNDLADIILVTIGRLQSETAERQRIWHFPLQLLKHLRSGTEVSHAPAVNQSDEL